MFNFLKYSSSQFRFVLVIGLILYLLFASLLLDFLSYFEGSLLFKVYELDKNEMKKEAISDALAKLSFLLPTLLAFIPIIYTFFLDSLYSFLFVFWKNEYVESEDELKVIKFFSACISILIMSFVFFGSINSGSVQLLESLQSSVIFSILSLLIFIIIITVTIYLSLKNIWFRVFIAIVYLLLLAAYLINSIK